MSLTICNLSANIFECNRETWANHMLAQVGHNPYSFDSAVSEARYNLYKTYDETHRPSDAIYTSICESWAIWLNQQCPAFHFGEYGNIENVEECLAQLRQLYRDVRAGKIGFEDCFIDVAASIGSMMGSLPVRNPESTLETIARIGKAIKDGCIYSA